MVAAGEEAAAERVELVEGDAELAEAGEELRLDGTVLIISIPILRGAVENHRPMNRVVDALVYRRLDVAVGLADADDLGDLPTERSSMNTHS